MSAELIMFGAQVVGNLLSGSAARAQQRAANTIAQANADAANTVRGANNELIRAKGKLGRWAQSVSNQRMARAGAEAHAAAMTTLLRRKDAYTRAGIEGEIQFAERAGQLAAAGAAAGVGGTTQQLLGDTLRLRQARAQQLMSQQERSETFDGANEAANIMRAAYEGMDQSLIYDAIDLNVNQSGNMPVQGNWLGDAIGVTPGTSPPNFRLLAGAMGGNSGASSGGHPADYGIYL